MCKGVKTSMGFCLFLFDQFLLRSTEANVLFLQDKHLSTSTHIFFGGLEQYGHQFCLYVIYDNFAVNS